MQNKDKRTKLIQLIHIAKAKLGMDDATYRAILADIGNASSSTKMTVSELEQVLEHFKKCGFKLVPKNKVNLPLTTDPQSKKIRALWLELHNKGIVRDSSEFALAKMVKRLTGVESLKWITSDQASMVIESLKQWLNRKGELG